MQKFWNFYWPSAKSVWLNPLFYIFFVAPFVFGGGLSKPINYVAALGSFLVIPVVVAGYRKMRDENKS